MNLLAASVVALCSLTIHGMSVDAFAADGVIYFHGQIVLSTMAPDRAETKMLNQNQPRHSLARQSLPLKAEIELLDYFAGYMRDRGVAQTQLTLQTSAYE